MADDEEAEVPVEEAPPPPPEEEGVEEAIVPKEITLPPPKYEVRPLLGEKFKAEATLQLILQSMQTQLTGRTYRADQVPQWCKQIANSIRQRTQILNMQRYKIIVQTFLIETKGAGVKCAQRCIWDPETDDYISGSFRNETIYCHTSVYGIYLY